MTSALARASVLICAGWWFLGHAATGRAQQTEADTQFVETIKAAAERGDPRQQCLLGLIYSLSKRSGAQDYAKAVYWFRKAAEQGLAEAQYRLGFFYSWGEGVAKDAAEAVKWYRKAAEQGNAEAQDKLGFRYAVGEGVPKDAAEAARWYRKAAEQGYANAQYNLGNCYYDGEGVAKDQSESVKWMLKAAEQGLRLGQYNLGLCYHAGKGVAQDYTESVKWMRKAAEQGYAHAQYNLGYGYYHGEGVAKDYTEAVKWYRKAAEQGFADAQSELGFCYRYGEGAGKDYVQAYKWFNLSAGQGNENASKAHDNLENSSMTREQISEGQRLAREFTPRETREAGVGLVGPDIAALRPEASGTGFFISEDGYLVTNAHVVKDASQVRLATQHGLIAARVVKVDAANDLAILKAEGNFSALPVASSRGVKLGATAATVGFPNIGLQGFAPKLAKGEIASLAGAQDDPRHFQISAPIQPGNSGGALVDERGNVIGVVVAKLSQQAALATSGQLVENVNYAVKSSFLLGLLESLPEVTARLKEPNSRERKFEEVVEEAQEAAALVLVY